MRAGNAEVAARKPTASPCISNGGDILPDAWDRFIPSRTFGHWQPGCVGLILRMRRLSTQGAQMKPYCGG